MPENKPKQKEETSLSWKHWILRVVLVIALFLIIAYIIDYYTHLPIVTTALIGFTVFLTIGFLHEALHYVTARHLKYKPEWYRTKVGMGFEIDFKGTHESHHKDKMRIAYTPYYVLFPVSIVVIVVGWYVTQYGILVAGVASVIVHSYTIFKEGKE